MCRSSWFLSRALGTLVKFYVGGCNGFQDVAASFVKGATESVSIGEVKLNLLSSSVEPGMVFYSWNCNLEVVRMILIFMISKK